MFENTWRAVSNNKTSTLGATIGVLAAATAVAMIYSPALFGLLSAGTLAALGFTPALLSVIAAFSVVMAVAFVSQIFNQPTLDVSNDFIVQAARESCSQNFLNAKVEIGKDKDGNIVPKIVCSEYKLKEGTEQLALLIPGKDNKGVNEVKVTATLKDGQVTFTSSELEKTLEAAYGEQKNWKETKALLSSNSKGVELHSNPCTALQNTWAEGFLDEVHKELGVSAA